MPLMDGQGSRFNVWSCPSGETVTCVAFSVDRPDLIALGCLSVVHIVQSGSLAPEDPSSWSLSSIASFKVGSPVTALDWSARTGSDGGILELAVACEDRKLRSITYLEGLPADEQPEILTFGGGLSGHRGRIRDVSFCRVEKYRSMLASTGDDCTCIIWNLRPNGADGIATPTAYSINLAHPGLSISFHPALFSQVLVFDSVGTCRLVDWGRPDRPVILSLVSPGALAGRLLNESGGLRGGADWKVSDANVFGAVCQGQWHVWDLRRLNGGKPVATGPVGGVGVDGADTFRWSPSNPTLFAIASSSPKAYEAVLLYNTSFPQAPRSLRIPAMKQQVSDLAWHPNRDVLAISSGSRVFFTSVAS